MQKDGERGMTCSTYVDTFFSIHIFYIYRVEIYQSQKQNLEPYCTHTFLNSDKKILNNFLILQKKEIF